MESSFSEQIYHLKDFLRWKKGGRSTREIDIVDNQDIFYTKSEIESFQTYTWAEYMSNRCRARSRNSEMDSMLTEILDNPEVKNYRLNGKCSLFRFQTPKGLDSYLMDYIHGNCYIFGNVRASVSRRTEPASCYFCNESIDSPLHQLLECTEVAEVTQRNLINDEGVTQTQHLLKELIFPTTKTTQRAFIERVNFLKDQHDIVTHVVNN